MHKTSQIIAQRLRRNKIPFLANDCIAQHINPGEMQELEKEVQEQVRGLLDALVIDHRNDHNSEGTAARVAKMFCREIYAGRFNPAPKLTHFPNIKKLDGVYVAGPCSVRSSCSHHMCPIIGKAWVGVIPGKRVVGLSKFNRVIDWICSRPQIQEEMVMQIADYLEQEISPKGLAVVIDASHTCMTWRGVRESCEAKMVTSEMRGAFRTKPEARAEFMALIK